MPVYICIFPDFSLFVKGIFGGYFAMAPPPTGSGPGTPEESKKSPERAPRGRAPRVWKECALESQKSPKRVQKSGSRLFSDSFETPERSLLGLLGPFAEVLFPDSFCTLPRFLGPKTLCGAGPIARLFEITSKSKNHL